MNKQIIEANLAFLQRVDLKGSETEAFMAVRQALVELLQAEPPAPELQVINQGHDLETK